MFAYLSADLIASTSDWSPGDVEALGHQIADAFRGSGRVSAMAVSQGDTFQLETPAAEALAVALIIDSLARRGGRAGMRVALALQSAPPGEQPITLRSGPAYVAASRGIDRLKQTRQRIGYFPDLGTAAGWVAACMLCGTLSEAQTTRQNEVMARLLLDRNTDQAGVARQMQISQQAVSRHYVAGRTAAILSAEQSWRIAHRRIG